MEVIVTSDRKLGYFTNLRDVSFTYLYYGVKCQSIDPKCHGHPSILYTIIYTWNLFSLYFGKVHQKKDWKSFQSRARYDAMKLSELEKCLSFFSVSSGWYFWTTTNPMRFFFFSLLCSEFGMRVCVIPNFSNSNTFKYIVSFWVGGVTKPPLLKRPCLGVQMSKP